jgi:hypothetical protein
LIPPLGNRYGDSWRNQSFLREQGLVGEGMAAKRNLQGGYDVATKIIAASFSVFFLYTTFFGLISQESHIGIYVLGTLYQPHAFRETNLSGCRATISATSSLTALANSIAFFGFIPVSSSSGGTK